MRTLNCNSDAKEALSSVPSGAHAQWGGAGNE
jgi:hypothetical protein